MTMAESSRTQIGMVWLSWRPEMLRASTTTPAVLRGVLQAVAEGHRGSRGRLGQAEAARDPARVGAAEEPEDRGHDEVAHDEPDDRRDDHRDDDLLPDDAPLHGHAGHQGSAGQTADEGVGRGRRQAEPPGEQVPADGADEGCGDEPQAVDARGLLDDAGADGLGHLACRRRRRRGWRSPPWPARPGASGPGSRPRSRSRWPRRGSRWCS